MRCHEHAPFSRLILASFRLASAGSLSAAARELGITTPAVSKHLAAMEARVGVSLVNRTTRRMSLTPEGELYLEHARRILAEIDDMAQCWARRRPRPRACCA
jgi:LysR family transcriptional activator of dmlA